MVASLRHDLDYVVFAMPRSMSRWLSVALSFNGHTCYHDIEHDIELPYEKGNGIAGSCETGTALANNGIVLLREPADSLNSMAAAYGIKGKELSDFVYRRYDELSSSGLPTYRYSELKNSRVVAEIQDMLLGESMSLRRIDNLLTAKITVSGQYLHKRLKDAAIH